jgi:hypothetical protein
LLQFPRINRAINTLAGWAHEQAEVRVTDLLRTRVAIEVNAKPVVHTWCQPPTINDGVERECDTQELSWRGVKRDVVHHVGAFVRASAIWSNKNRGGT